MTAEAGSTSHLDDEIGSSSDEEVVVRFPSKKPRIGDVGTTTESSFEAFSEEFKQGQGQFKTPTGRPKRKRGRPRPPRPGDDVTDKAWHLVEKTKLLSAIRRFGTENTEVLSDQIKTRTREEVEQFIKKTIADDKRPKDKKKEKKTPRDFSNIEYFHKFNFFDPNPKTKEETEANNTNENKNYSKENTIEENLSLKFKAALNTFVKTKMSESKKDPVNSSSGTEIKNNSANSCADSKDKDKEKSLFENDDQSDEVKKDKEKSLFQNDDKSDEVKSEWYREDSSDDSSSDDDRDDQTAPTPKKSPIELWTDLIYEITAHEPYDFSQDVSKVFNLIAKFEEFQPSGLPRLNWRKMYQFVADLLQGKAELQELSDVESHILIDMMQGLGDVLHSSDTSLQHRLLTMKFSMLDGDGSDRTTAPRRRIEIARAFNNDFDYKGDGSYTGPRRLATFRSNPDSAQAGPSSAPDDGSDIADFKKPQLFTLNPLCVPTSLLPLKSRINYF